MPTSTPEFYYQGTRNIIAHFERTFGRRMLNRENQEILDVLGPLVETKIKEGWRFGGSIYPVYSSLFFSEDPGLIAKRDQLIQEYGGPEKFEFYVLVRTGEVVVFIKD